MGALSMAGELHEISRLLGQLESKIEAVVNNQLANAQLTHARLDVIETKISPLEVVVADHAEIKRKQAHYDDLLQRGYGIILAVIAIATAAGFIMKEAIIWGLRKIGLWG
jgi:hypothetical protein